TKGKRLKTLAKTTKPTKKKQPAKMSMDKGLIVLSEIAVTEAKQLNLVIERSKTQTHISHASGSGADEGTGSLSGVPDVPTYNSDDEQISWKSSEEDNCDEVNMSEDDDTNNDEDDNDDDVHKDINDDDADNQDKDDKDAENPDDDNEQTDSDNNGDDFVHPKFSTHDEEESFILEGQQQSSSVSYGFISNMLNPSPDTGIDSLFTESPSLVDVPVTTIVEPPLLSTTTLPPPPTPATVPSSSLQDLPNFSSLFRFDHRLKTLETNFSEFKQTNHFTEAVSSIPGIFDAYLANKMHEAVKTVVQLQSERIRDETLAKNADFLNKLDDNIKKIIKD
ncbi:hypothetical protein Tco_1573159, partial [Tanacetum coccineum]